MQKRALIDLFLWLNVQTPRKLRHLKINRHIFNVLWIMTQFVSRNELKSLKCSMEFTIKRWTASISSLCDQIDTKLINTFLFDSPTDGTYNLQQFMTSEFHSDKNLHKISINHNYSVKCVNNKDVNEIKRHKNEIDSKRGFYWSICFQLLICGMRNLMLIFINNSKLIE